jgi:hypothetical protein
MGCIYILNGIEYNEEQLKEYLAKNLEDFSAEISGEEAKTRGINNAANEIRRRLLGMESYDPDIVTNFQANQEAESLLKDGYDVNKLLDKLQRGEPVTLVQQEILKILNIELDAKIADNPTDELLEKQRRLALINDIIGTDAARVLQARKGMPAPMTTISDFYIDKMNKNGVDVLTKAQKEEAKADFEEKINTDKEVERLKQQVDDYAVKELAEREINEAKRNPKKRDFAAEKKKVVSDIRQKLKNIRQGRSGITAVPLPGVQELIEIAPDVAKLVRILVDENVNKLDDIIDKIYKILKAEIGVVTKKDVRDIIGGKYNKPRETKSELQIKIDNLKKEARLLTEIEEVKAGKPKTEREEIKKNQRITDLNKQLIQAKKEAGYYDEKGYLTDEEADLINKIKEEKKKITEEKAPTKRLTSAVDRVNEQVKELQRRINEGDFSEKPKKLNILEDRELRKNNPELFNKYLDALEKKDELLFKYNEKMAREEIKSKRGFERVAAETGKFAEEGFNTVKALKAGIDNSVVFIQNGIAVLNPMNIKATVKGFQAQANVVFSETNFRRRLTEIFANKELIEMVNLSGLDIIDPKGFRESITNEQFGGKNLLEKAKVKIGGKEYKASMLTAPFERIFAAFSNEFRLQIFLRGAEKLIAKGKTLDNNIDDFKSLASYANNITGRGKIHPFLKKGQPIISTLIWAPGLMSSSLNIIYLGDLVSWANPYSYGAKGKGKGYYRNMTPEVRKYAAKETAAGIAMGVLVMAAMALDDDKEVDYNPTSVTFGQVRDTKNGWSYNIFGRFTPYIRLIAMRAMEGKKIDGKPIKYDAKAEGYKFFRGKAAPVAGVVSDLIFSENFQGKRYTINDKAQIARDLFEPLFIADLRKQMEIDGTDAILTRGIPSFIGIKVVNEKMYDERDLPTLLKNSQDSESMDKALMINYNDKGRYINKEEFNQFVKERNKLIGAYITAIYEKGIPVVDETGENVIVKPIKEVTKEELIKEINRIKTLATRNVKEKLFGEKPAPENYIKRELKYTRDDLGIGNPEVLEEEIIYEEEP